MITKIGRVYKIVSALSDDIYIGSTFNKIHYRFRQHKNDFKKWNNDECSKCVFFPLFKKYGVKNFKIILIKEYEVIDRKHLLSKQQIWINKLKKNINKNNPFEFSLKKIYEGYEEETYEDEYYDDEEDEDKLYDLFEYYYITYQSNFSL